jgi:hypothetical protein
MPPITVRGVGVETKGEQLLATFTLSEPPGREWIQFFKERAGASILNVGAATFRRNRLSVEVAGQGDLEMPIRSVEAMIEGGNFDVEFRR